MGDYKKLRVWGAADRVALMTYRATQAFPAAELMHIYGATETSPMVTVLPHEERLLDTPLARSCGPAWGSVEEGGVEDE